MAQTPSPDTVTDAVAFLEREGYSDEFKLAPGETLLCPNGPHPADAAVIDYVFRFEGPSDPADEAIVLGLSFPSWGGKGMVISAFGTDADPESTATLLALTRRA